MGVVRARELARETAATRCSTVGRGSLQNVPGDASIVRRPGGWPASAPRLWLKVEGPNCKHER